MTTIEMLQAEGLSAEEIGVLTGNPKYTATLEKMRAKAENGETALLNAKKLEEDIKKFNTETVIPYGLKKDQETAAATGELAKTKAYLKSLKDSGYDIPDDYLAAPTPTAPVAPTAPTSGLDPDKMVTELRRASMSLISISERARDLLGHGLDMEAEYSDFEKNRRPGEVVRDFIDRKYELASKQAAKEEEKRLAAEKKIADAAIEKYKAEHPISADPERQSPRASKFDRLAELPTERKQLWQTAQGRDQATKHRIAKYSTVQ